MVKTPIQIRLEAEAAAEDRAARWWKLLILIAAVIVIGTCVYAMSRPQKEIVCDPAAADLHGLTGFGSCHVEG